MKFRQIGLPTVAASLMGFVFMGPQAATSQSPAPNNDPFAQQPDANYGGQDTLRPLYEGVLHRTGDSELEKLHKQEAETHNAVSSLLAAYGRTEKEGERATIKKKLTEALVSQFDAQQKRRELEVTRIESQLKKLRDLIKKRTDNKEKIIDRHLDQLLQDAEGLGWSSPVGTSFYQSSYSVPTITTAPSDASRP